LYRLVKTQRFDLIHGHSSKAGFLGRIAAKLANAHAVTVYSPHAIAISANRAYQPLERLAGLFTDAILAVSRSERDELEGYHLVSPPKLHYVTAGIDVPGFARFPRDPEFRRRIGVPDGALLIGSAGRIARQKDPVTFLQAAARLCPHEELVYFAWAGEGEMRRECEQLARALGIEDRVRFVGYCSDVRPFLASLDIFALTSRYESFGYVTCEAMAMGLPVVATNVAGSNELVRHEATGYLVDVGDAEGCAQRLRTLIKNSFLRRAMAEAGRKRVSDYYGVDRMVRQVETLYQELLGGSSQWLQFRKSA
jgi:glycosyltransferase involved in cell wall biosynthesis